MCIENHIYLQFPLIGAAKTNKDAILKCESKIRALEKRMYSSLQSSAHQTMLQGVVLRTTPEGAPFLGQSEPAWSTPLVESNSKVRDNVVGLKSMAKKIFIKLEHLRYQTRKSTYSLKSNYPT